MKKEEPLGIAFLKEVIHQHELLLKSKIQRLKQVKTELIEIEKEGDMETIKLFNNEIDKSEEDIKRGEQKINELKEQISIKC